MTEISQRFGFDSAAKKITVKAGKVEIGQHIHSAFQKIVADTLEIDKTHVRVSAVSTHTTPNDGLTVGSLSIQVTGASLRSAAVTLRTTLFQQAAQKLQTDIDNITLDAATLQLSAQTTHCSIFDLPVAKDNPVTVNEDSVDVSSASTIAASIRGERIYIQDLVLPGMLYARALRGHDTTTINADNVRVIEVDGFGALVADTEGALDFAWSQLDTQPAAKDATCDGPVTDWIRERQALTQTTGSPAPINASVCQSATRPFILHASIAPSCAIARFYQGVLEIWTHSQGIFPLRDAMARHLDMEADKVIVRHVPSAGSYGHNGADDAAMDAALVCMQNKGNPVRVAWTRQDDFQHAPVGAAMHVQIEAQMAEDNSILNWQQIIWSTPHGQRPGGGGNTNLLAAIEQDPKNKSTHIPDLAIALGGGATRNATPPYSIGSVGVTSHIVQDLPVRTSSIRGLGAQMNVVCIEATMNKLAESCGIDPLEFRLMQLKDPRGGEVLRRLKSVLDAAIGDSLPETEAIGIGYSRYKDKAAYAAVAARVRLTQTVELLDVWVVVDAGNIVDRCGATNQIEGGIIQAASWTLCEGVLLRDGVIDAGGWDDYPIIGWSDIPQIHTTLIDKHNDSPSLGVGECMVGPASAAIVNGVSILAGCSMTDLPLTREKFIQAAAGSD